MRNDPLNPFFDVSGLVHVWMYARACVRVCVRVCACEMWMHDVAVSKMPRILNLLLPSTSTSSYYSYPLPLTPFPYSLGTL